MAQHWDIFCRVIDNFGDIGVTWRLARQLANEHGKRVRLWVDDLAVFVKMNSSVNPDLEIQQLGPIEVRHWKPGSEFVSPADVVIEAFACQLPEKYILAMAAKRPESVWINLEYLSAETWVEGCHGLASPQLAGPAKYFFFPGFTRVTGGLLRESQLLADRDRFLSSPGEQLRLLNALGIPPLEGGQKISLFAYDNLYLTPWLDHLASARAPTQLWVTQSKVRPLVQDWLGITGANTLTGAYTRGALSVYFLPFLNHQDYDRLLWLSDINLVRGEDSLVRAIWAGKPFVWHIYPQEEDTHLIKLSAFLASYLRSAPECLKIRTCDLWNSMNMQQDFTQAWKAWQECLNDAIDHASVQCEHQSLQENLTDSLVNFCEMKVKYAPEKLP